MATFISLVNWTEQGISTFKDTPKRLDAVKEIMGKHGATFRDMYWTIGAYDVVAVIEAPDDESATAALLEIGAMGNVRTTTLRAFNRAEFDGILKTIG